MNYSTMKNLSIIVPTYKRPDQLARCLHSIQSQFMESIEIIVIDDDPDMSGSETVKKFQNIQYFCKRGHNRGLSCSRNIGIDISNGKYLIFIDDDDYFEPDAIDIFLQSARSDASFYYGDFTYIHDDESIEIDQKEVILHKLMIMNSIPVGSFMIERASLRHHFDESMRSHEDWDFLLKNINWNYSHHIPRKLVSIDKTSSQTPSMQDRRRSLFWIDFINIYSRNPAPELAEIRKEALAGLGISIPPELLLFDDIH